MSNQLTLFKGSEEFFPALIKSINNARSEIRLETYIFDFHGDSLLVARALEQAALKGVEVYLLIDGVGTPELDPVWSERWLQSRVQCRIYDPVSFGALWYPSRWRRLHRKLCVIDQTVGFCGGINILDDHYDPHQHAVMEFPRLDFAVQVHGPCVQTIWSEMSRLWQRLDWAIGWKRAQLSHCTDIRGGALHSLPSAAQDAVRATRVNSGTKQCHLVLRDNIRHRTSILSAYINAIDLAHSEILIASAFFFPQNRFKRALVMAAQRGVRVQLLLQGHYEFALSYRAARKMYGELLNAGVEIIEYQSSYLHAKVAVIDGRWCTVGSSNLDPLSLLLAKEANLVIHDAAFAQSLRSEVLKSIERGGASVDAEHYGRQTFWERLGDQMYFGLMKFAIFLTGRHY